MATVSVIIPAYNRAGVIRRAIESICAQTFHDMEIIVVDDGSADNTGDAVQSIPDARIRCIRCETNRGPSAARNEGLRAARGKYVAFLDSDDEWLPWKIEKQIALMESLSEDWGVCHTGARIVKDGAIKIIFRPAPGASGEVFHRFVLDKVPFLFPTLVVRRACIDRAGQFDERLWIGQDAEFLFRILKIYKLAVIPEALATIHGGTTPRSAERVESSRLAILAKHEAAVRDEFGRHVARRFRGNTFWLIADAEFREGNLGCGVKYFARAVANLPFMPPGRYARIFLAASGLLNILKRIRVAFSSRHAGGL